MRILVKILTLAGLALIWSSCSGEMKTSSGAYTSAAVAADEKAQAEEKRPDFSSPQVEDKTIDLPGLPEKLTWYTSKPGVWGSSRAKAGGTIRTYLPDFPETFRTVGPNSNDSFRLYLLSSPGLVDINNETKEFIPALATHWAFAKDGKTVFFKLNEKVKWNDGTPVTSADYVFAIQFMRSPHITDPWYNEYYTTQITDLKAYGDYVISVTAYAQAPQEELLTTVSLNPRPKAYYGGEIKKDWVDEFQWKVEPTTGPYVLSDFKKGESITFKKVKDWWGYCYDYNKYRYNIETFEAKVITGGNDNVRNYFYKGELDQFAAIIPQEWEDSGKREAYLKGYADRQFQYYVPLTGTSGIYFNLKDPLFADKNVRKAMYYGMNIQKMIDTVLRGEYSRYHNIGLAHVFGGQEFDDNTIRKPDFDPVKAGELLDKAGYSIFDQDGIRKNAAGKRVSFELLYSTPNHTERLSLLKEEAKKAGVEIQLKLMQSGAFTAVREKKFQAWWGGMSTNLYDDYWEYFHSKNADKTQTNNFWSYASPEMDKVLDAFRVEGTLAKKAELDRKIQRIVDEEALVVPNYYVPFMRTISWKWVRYPSWLGQKFDANYLYVFGNPGVNGSGGASGYLWIDSDIKKEVLSAQKSGKAYESRTFINDLYKAK